MIRIYLRYLAVVSIILTGLTVFSTTPIPIDSVDYSRITHKKVRKLILKQKQFGVRTFDDISPVCYSDGDSVNYNFYQKTQLIKQDISVVWNNLVKQQLNDEFDGRIVSLGLLYSKSKNNIGYKNEAKTGIEVGQILFFNLRMLRGIKNLAVALEVTKVDNELKTVEYCYVDHGNTKGTQQVSLKPTPEGYTEITQMTRYKCNSKFRASRLYAFFHERIVKEFFSAIKFKSEKEKDMLAGTF